MLHVDLDQFVAAVEVLRDPSLVGKPVVVGGRGDPTLRGVVSTASYEARAFGVGSGMPLRTAVKKAPDAVFLPVDGPLYDEASAGVMAVLRSFGPTDGAVVEVLGWDEAFVGVVTDDPEALARRMQAAVLAQTRLHCSVGIGQTKVMAKTATGFGKPQGVYTITADTWYEIMGPRPTEALWGVGRKTSAKLAALGIETVSQLALSDAELLVTRLGPTMGPWYRRIARGGDRSPVTATPWVARGHGRETTFQENLSDWDIVAEEVRTLAARVLDDIVAEGRPAIRVGLKVRYAPFTTRTASAPLPSPTVDLPVIAGAAVALLSRFDERRSVRLLGVRLEMQPPDGGYAR
ncbi:MAG TPA: DNA polymerase IV [Lapillicoccus sp.]|uniref:DNA polymerase IV n=1 Tax=Lapillicoccus sp. TaxID=1909287 RepID=UPI002F92BF3D